MDEPIRRIRNPISSFTHGGTFVAPDVGDYLAAALGLLGLAIAVGAEIFRFTGAFLRGRRFFSSQDLTIHPSDSLLRFYLKAEWARLGHLLSQQPVYQLALPLRVGASLGPMFFDSIERIGFSARGSCLSLLGGLSGRIS